MKTVYQVKVVYNKANSQANNIDNIANSIDKKRQKLTDERYKLANYWSGNNANVYRCKMSDRENELASLVSDLRNIASTIRRVAENSYNADMAAIKIAQKKTKK